MFGVENYKIFKEKTLFGINGYTIITGKNGSGKSTYTDLLNFMIRNFKDGPKYFLNTDFIKTKEVNIGNERIEHFNRLGKPITFYYNNISAVYIYDELWKKYKLSAISMYSQLTDTELVSNMFDTDVGIVVEVDRNKFEIHTSEKKRLNDLKYKDIEDKLRKDLDKVNELHSQILTSQGIVSNEEKVKEAELKQGQDYYQYYIPFNSEELSFTPIVDKTIDSYFNYSGLGDPYYYSSNSISIHKVFDETLNPNLKLREIIGTNKNVWLDKYLRKINFCDELQITELLEGIFRIEIERNGVLIPIHRLSKGEYKFIVLVLFITSTLEYNVEDLSNSIKNIVIEEPETALHPNLQSKIADFIAHLYSFPVFDDMPDELSQHFIIETHSEYLIRKLQYLVAKGEIPNLDVSLYYFDYIEGCSKPYEIQIKENGTLSKEFGTGFFDEADNIAIELFKVEKTRNN